MVKLLFYHFIFIIYNLLYRQAVVKIVKIVVPLDLLRILGVLRRCPRGIFFYFFYLVDILVNVDQVNIMIKHFSQLF